MMTQTKLEWPIDTNLIETRRKLGRKFTADDLELTTPFKVFAENYARNYRGNFGFMISMRESVEEWGRLTPKQVPGVLNCAYAEYERGQQSLEQAHDEPVVAVEVPVGRFTVEFEDGEYVTLQLKPGSGNFEGKTIASFLAGPDNTNDYVGFGMVVDGEFRVWNRFNNGHNTRKIEAVKRVLGSTDPGQFGMSYAMRSGRCCKCGRELTVPASIHRGMGADCASRA